MGPNPNIERRLRAAVESSPSGLLMIDPDGRIVLVNREIERLFDYSREELLGRPVEMLVPERFRAVHPTNRGTFADHPRVRAMGAGRDLYGRRKDGTEVPVEIGLTPVATEDGLFVISSIVDISARKRAEAQRAELEEQLRQSQKIEAVGTLAGGIAHDFNNILGTIIGYAELLQDALPDDRTRADLHELLRVANRGKELITRILSFSRRQEVTRKPVALGPVLDEALKLLRATLPASIDITLDVHPEVPRVLADVTSVHQVLMNLVTNAAGAMPNGGALHLRIEPSYLRDSTARARGVREGPYACLIVSDTGHGMDATVRERAFEPFFTTKPPGAGTGLGLSVVHGIMRDHEGTIDLESEPGQGTIVRCFFPALLADMAAEPAVQATIPQGRGERILLVDDEPLLAQVSARRLRRLGYEVTVETDPLDAIARFRTHPELFDLLITDYSMPHLTGLDIARAALEIRPDLPIIMATGFTDEKSAAAYHEAGIRLLLQKPLTGSEMGHAIHSLLGTSRNR